jgi:uncharacterized phage protein gp47/JayE
MAVTLDQVSAQILSNLRLTDPELDTSVGTPARKIIDAVAYSISQAYVDNHILQYQYDIDSKSGGDLDQFTQLFGITRLTAKRSNGSVLFARSGEPDITISIPANATLSSNTDPIQIFQTITSGLLSPGETTVSIPVECLESGVSGNVAASTIVNITSPLTGISSVTNIAPTTGGTAAESDSELRARWKATVFRSMAGTEDMYRGIALADANVTSATVLGSSKRYREKVQIVSGDAISTVPDAKYVYPTNVFFGEDIDAGTIAIQGSDYTWDSASNPPEINDVDPLVPLGEGDIADLSFEYVSTSSRNDPENGISNKVDVWTAGRRLISATQTLVFQDALEFNTTSGDLYNIVDWQRLNPVDTNANGRLSLTELNPVDNNIFVPLVFGPIYQIPDLITDSNGDTYGRMGVAGTGADYEDAFCAVHHDTAEGYSPTSLFGLEWDYGQLPANGSTLTIGNDDDYIYNVIPSTVQVEIDRWRLVGIDALAHQAREWLLRFNFAVMYDGAQSITATNTAIDDGISRHLTMLGVGGVIQASDILQIVRNVSGVDAVRFLDASDIGGYSYGSRDTYDIGIQRVATEAGGDNLVVETFITTAGRCQDVVLQDSTYSSFESHYITIKAQNSFGA